MRVSCVCFDLDDTLYDYREYARTGLEAAADRLEVYTGERYHDDLHRLYFEEGVTDGTFDRLLEEHDLSQSLVEDLVEAYHDATAPLSPYPETTAVLNRLHSVPLGLITDGRGGHNKLDRLGIRDQFDSVVVTPTLDTTKCDPVVFRTVLAELDVSPEEAVYVGDDPRFDFRVPNQLGMATIRLRRGRYTDVEPDREDAAPDHEIRHLDRLLTVLSVGEPEPTEN